MISVPVYSDENGTPQISIYAEDEDGTFRRTQSEPLRLLRDDIKGISIIQGDLVSNHYDRQNRHWQSPTVTFHYGRPQSYYQFLRDKVAHNRFFVFAKPQMSGHISKFSLHELQLKNSTSQRKIALLKEKYIEALELWPQEQLEAQAEQNARNKRIADPQSGGTASSHDVNHFGDIKLASEAAQSPDDSPQAGSHDISQPRRKGREISTSTDIHSNHNPSAATEASINSTTTSARKPGVSDGGKRRKNLVQEFSLAKSGQQGSPSKPKKQHKHFYDRFIFTIE